MEDVNFRKGDAKTEVFGSNRMLQPSPVEKIPDGPTTPEIAYESGYIRYHLYGRLCHQADERGDQH